MEHGCFVSFVLVKKTALLFLASLNAIYYCNGSKQWNIKGKWVLFAKLFDSKHMKFLSYCTVVWLFPLGGSDSWWRLMVQLALASCFLCSLQDYSFAELGFAWCYLQFANGCEMMPLQVQSSMLCYNACGEERGELGNVWSLEFVSSPVFSHYHEIVRLYLSIQGLLENNHLPVILNKT